MQATQDHFISLKWAGWAHITWSTSEIGGRLGLMHRSDSRVKKISSYMSHVGTQTCRPGPAPTTSMTRGVLAESKGWRLGFEYGGLSAIYYDRPMSLLSSGDSASSCRSERCFWSAVCVWVCEMGNCQAIDAASLVIQHPSGRVERLYWPVTVSEVMRMNRDHHVALVITLGSSEEEEKTDNINGVRITRVKLLRPTDTLVLGQAYRLITSQEVMKGLREKKYAKKKKKEAELAEKREERTMENQGSGFHKETTRSELEKANQGPNHERNRQRTTTSSASARSKTWRPSLQSISEAARPEADFVSNI